MSWWSRGVNVFHDDRINREIDEELQSHLDEAVARGRDPEEARRALGSALRHREESRDVKITMWLENLLHDVRYALRMLRKSPAFATVAIASLTLGIGANIAVFTLIDALLLRTLPVQHPEELVELRVPGRFISFPMYQDLRIRQQVFTDIAATQRERAIRLTIPAVAEPPSELDNVSVASVTGNYFALLGIQPALGRFFTSADDRDPGSSQQSGSVIVLSDELWERQFHRDPQILGRVIFVDRSLCRIVGVAPRGFKGERVGAVPDAWVPLVPFNPLSNLEGRRGTFTAEIARLKPGVHPEQAQVAVTTLFQQLLQAEGIVKGDISRYRIVLAPADAGIDSGVRIRYLTPLTIVLAITMLVLLIACANVANLLIARGAQRRCEIAVRLAIGCSRSRLTRQLLTESVLLSMIGAALGVVVAYWGRQSLLQLVYAGQTPVRLDLTPDVWVLLFLVAVVLVTGIGFGMYPAWRAGRVDHSSLQHAGRGTELAARRPFGRMLVTAQIALSLPLLVGAGLLLESFRNLHQIDWGFRPEHVVVFELQHNPRTREPGTLARVVADIERRVGELPGVESASVSWILLFSTTDQRASVHIPGYVAPPEDRARFAFLGDNVASVRYNPVSPKYFETVGMTLVAGRHFETSDKLGGPLVAIINEALARATFPTEEPSAERSQRRTGQTRTGPFRSWASFATPSSTTFAKTRCRCTTRRLPSRRGSYADWKYEHANPCRRSSVRSGKPLST